MKFTTKSGSQYEITDVDVHSDTFMGQTIQRATGRIRRLGNVVFDPNGSDIDMNDGEWHDVRFNYLPRVNETFVYYTPEWGVCYSTPVTEVETGNNVTV